MCAAHGAGSLDAMTTTRRTSTPATTSITSSTAATAPTLTAADAPLQPRPPRIVIVGGGFVGFTLARRLQRGLRRDEAEVVLVDASPSMTYQPFLAETAAGCIEPRHVAVPLRSTLRHTRVITGRVTDVDRSTRQLRIALPDGMTTLVEYDELVLAPGSVTRTQPVPGLTTHAVGFTSLAEARHLRDTVLTRLALAADAPDQDRRRSALTFVVIGGGYSGVEAVAELQDLAVAAARRFPGLSADAARFVLVEAAAELLSELPPELGAYARRRLTRSGVEVRLRRQVRSITGGVVELSDGDRLAADTVVWAAGVRGNPLLGRLGLPTDPRGRLVTRATLQVEGAPHLWAAGDGAAVPDLSRPPAHPGSVPMCGATAQHAVRQARVLARNLVSALRGRPLTAYVHRDAGTVASLGRHRGVARVYGVPLRGLPAWVLHRVYHLAMVPTFGRKVRIALGWVGALVGRRDLTTPELSGGLQARLDGSRGVVEARG